jgi:DnaJ-like protein
VDSRDSLDDASDPGSDDARDGHGPDEESVDESRPAQRLEQQTLWVDAQIRRAMARGDFDNLPGAGKPIEGIGETHDPEWWVKNLIRREQISGLGPPAILLRKEDAELDDRLDRISAEAEVRRILADFNARVVNARRQLHGGPPVVTPTRDIDAEVEAWRDRRSARIRARREARQSHADETSPTLAADGHRPPGRRWWRRRRSADRPDPTQG